MSEESRRFQERIEDLVGQFEEALRQTEWILRRYPKRLRGESREIYEVPSLYIQKGPTSLLLYPIGYDVVGAEWGADLYQMPAHDPMVSLFFEEGRWMFYCDFPKDSTVGAGSSSESVARPISAETIHEVMDRIVEHALPTV